MKKLDTSLNNVLSIFACMILIMSCTTQSTPLEEDPKTLSGSVGTIEVEVFEANVIPFEYYIHATGKIIAQHQIEVLAKASGVIKRLNATNGTLVNENVTLLTLENDQQQLAIEKTTAQLNERTLQYKNDIIAFGNEKQLNTEHGKIIKENIRHSSGLAIAEVNYKEAQLKLSYTVIVASIGGVVADLEVKQGNEVKIGDKICVVYNPNQLLIETQVIESEIGKLQFGQQAEIQTLANSFKTYTAQITEINPSVNRETGKVKIKLIINKPQGLLPGMNASLLIKVPYNNNIIVPKEAVVLRSGKAVVFTMEDNLAKWNYVTLGNENGKEVEILEGLEENQQVIVTNNLQLAHDAPVSKIKVD